MESNKLLVFPQMDLQDFERDLLNYYGAHEVLKYIYAPVMEFNQKEKKQTRPIIDQILELFKLRLQNQIQRGFIDLVKVQKIMDNTAKLFKQTSTQVRLLIQKNKPEGQNRLFFSEPTYID